MKKETWMLVFCLLVLAVSEVESEVTKPTFRERLWSFLPSESEVTEPTFRERLWSFLPFKSNKHAEVTEPTLAERIWSFLPCESKGHAVVIKPTMILLNKTGSVLSCNYIRCQTKYKVEWKSNLTLMEGAQVVLPCPNTKPVSSVVWRKGRNFKDAVNLVQFHEEFGVSYAVGDLDGRLSMSDDFSLIISDVNANDRDIYWCKLIDSYEEVFCSISVESNAVVTESTETLLEGIRDALPCSYSKPVQNVSWLKGSTIDKAVKLVQLYKNFGLVYSPGDPERRFSISDDFALHIRDLNANDGGRYWCEIDGSFRNYTDVCVIVLSYIAHGIAAIIFILFTFLLHIAHRLIAAIIFIRITCRKALRNAWTSVTRSLNWLEVGDVCMVLTSIAFKTHLFILYQYSFLAAYGTALATLLWRRTSHGPTSFPMGLAETPYVIATRIIFVALLLFQCYTDEEAAFSKILTGLTIGGLYITFTDPHDQRGGGAIAPWSIFRKTIMYLQPFAINIIILVGSMYLLKGFELPFSLLCQEATDFQVRLNIILILYNLLPKPMHRRFVYFISLVNGICAVFLVIDISFYWKEIKKDADLQNRVKFMVPTLVISTALILIKTIILPSRRKTGPPDASGLPECKTFRIGVCSSADPVNIEGFVGVLNKKIDKIGVDVQYIPLPYSKLDEFPLEERLEELSINILILCHSIDNRRLSLTNVTDALYDNFIPRASKKIGKEAFVVIIHDFQWQVDDEESRITQEESLKIKQPDTYKHADTVLLMGKLQKDATDIGIHKQDWKKLEDVVFRMTDVRKGRADEERGDAKKEPDIQEPVNELQKLLSIISDVPVYASLFADPIDAAKIFAAFVSMYQAFKNVIDAAKGLESKTLRIGVCSSAIPENTEGFVKVLKERFADKSTEITYIQLPYNNLDEFPLEKKFNELGINILILCHSIENRRLSLTNVTDALYDDFIPRASKKVGKEAFIVIAHDFKWQVDDDRTRSKQEEVLMIKQPDTYKHAGTILLAGKLKTIGTDKGIHDRDWKKLNDVMVRIKEINYYQKYLLLITLLILSILIINFISSINMTFLIALLIVLSVVKRGVFYFLIEGKY